MFQCGMQQARDLSDSSLVISYIIVVLVIGILIDLVFNRADNALHVVLSLAMIGLGVLGTRLRKPWEVPSARA